MAVVINNLIAFKILYMLITPFTDTDAYKLGIIDEKGKNLIKSSNFKTAEQRNAYTYLHRLVFNMKKILGKLPGGDAKLKNIIAAMFLIKEYHETKDRSYDLMEERLNSILESDAVLVEETIIVEKFFKDISEDGAPTNATGAAVSTDQAAIKKKDIEKYKLKNSGALKFVRRKNLNVVN